MLHKFEYGICRQSVVPIRAEAKHVSAQVTQLLFGDHYKVLDHTGDGNWVLIEIEYDNYCGWLDVRQHTEINQDHFQHLNTVDFKVCMDLVSSILYKKKLINIVIGSILPVSSMEMFDISEQLAFNGESRSTALKGDYEFLHAIARKYHNAPYLWGGKSPFGIDCSGFTQQVFKICGYKLKRDAKEQFLQGTAVENTESSKQGDLAFFGGEDGKITHVGIITEGAKIIHASGSVREDHLDEKGIFNNELQKYTHTLRGIRRFL
ncbi:MAG: C40 family peptidase [Cyclobacteriaceae bacterium]|nr:C40 family peptidase [Cyclobacteriaceae bacterium]